MPDVIVDQPPQVRTATPMAMDSSVVSSMAYCHEVTRRRAKNFYYGLKLTPEPKRSALYVVYAFMRACDDLADEPVGWGASSTNQVEQGQDSQRANQAQEGLARIERFRQVMQSVLADEPQMPADSSTTPLGRSEADRIWPGFRYVMRTYPIDATDLHAMLDGQRCDLQQTRYHTFEQLYDYCYKVASVVGLVCISVWGYQGGQATRKLAEYRGIAFQLTNILRDLAEDAQRDRVYLPEEDLQRFGLDSHTFAEQLLADRLDDGFDQMMDDQIDRAKSYYARSASLERYLDPACRSTSWAMMKIYHGLLEKIARSPRRVLHHRIRLHTLAKIGIATRAACRCGFVK